ncbi:MAG: ComEC/Rec2 family competence protein [Bacteroidaceae bacterium]|nr:ComEC/Rec2 family competence protein [Bacteroidaceae bacterium]
MKEQYWELSESPLFFILFPLTIGMVVGFWGENLFANHLLFILAVLLLAAACSVAIHLFLYRHPFATGMHRLFHLFAWLFVLCFGLILAVQAEPHTISIDFFSHSRDVLLARLEQTMLTDREQQLLKAVLLGYKADLSDEVRTAFQTAGISHLLALSGLHVGMIVACVGWILPRRLPMRKLWLAVFLWMYVLLVGCPVSAVRAGLMTTIWLMNPFTRQHTFNMDVVALSAILLLVFNPLYLKEVGFQMSFAAVSCILLFSPGFRYVRSIPKAPQQWFWVCLSAQLGVTPFVLWYFGSFPTYFLIANLIITPIIMPAILYLGLTLLLVVSIAPAWSDWLCIPMHGLFEVEWWMMQQIQLLPSALLAI